MLLTLSTTHRPATDLGYLLHKNPASEHTADLGFGVAHVVYPEVTEDRCTVALLLEIDPVSLVRGSGRFDQYVNDRPYAASSFLSVAMGRVFGTAMTGRSKERQELADTPIPLEAHLPVLPSRGGEALLRRLFEPLGYQLEIKQLPLDERFPEWGASPYFDVTLQKTARLQDLLNHLYVLIPVLDDDKHYWVDKDEIDKLLRKGKDWLESHPDKNEIVRRYLRGKRELTREALARLTEIEGDPDPDAREADELSVEEAVERPISLHEQRLAAVTQALKDSGARSVVDLGCGEGKLIRLLLQDKQFERIVGMDVSLRVLETAERRLRLDDGPMPLTSQRDKAGQFASLATYEKPKTLHARDRVRLIHGSLLYRDHRLDGFDAAAVVEVIEHLDPPRLAAFERNLFEFARPKTVVITTPNQEYNALFETLPEGKFRHKDHRFEWSRAEFKAWSNRVAADHRYNVAVSDIGPVHGTHGAPSQAAVFTIA